MKTLLKIGLATISIIAAFKLVKGAEMMYKYKKNPDSLSEKDRHRCKVVSNVLDNTDTLESAEGISELIYQCGKEIKEYKESLKQSLQRRLTKS